MLKAILFDWGDTLMVDFPDQKGPMHSWDRIEMVRNADSCLRELAREFPLYLATNAKDSSKPEILRALSVFHLDKYLTDVFCFQEIQAPKPSLFFFQFVSKRTGFHPSELLMIGDDREKDYLGPRKYGVNSILFDRGNEHPDISDRVADLDDIPIFLKTQDYYRL